MVLPQSDLRRNSVDWAQFAADTSDLPDVVPQDILAQAEPHWLLACQPLTRGMSGKCYAIFLDTIRHEVRAIEVPQYHLPCAADWPVYSDSSSDYDDEDDDDLLLY